MAQELSHQMLVIFIGSNEEWSRKATGTGRQTFPTSCAPLTNRMSFAHLSAKGVITFTSMGQVLGRFHKGSLQTFGQVIGLEQTTQVTTLPVQFQKELT